MLPEIHNIKNKLNTNKKDLSNQKTTVTESSLSQSTVKSGKIK